MLTVGLAIQRAVVARRRQALAVAQFARPSAGAIDLEQASCAWEEAGRAALEHVIEILANQGTEAAAEAVVQRLQGLAGAARQPWADLARTHVAI